MKPDLETKCDEVCLGLTIRLEGGYATKWREFCREHSNLKPSNGQLALCLIQLGLESLYGGEK